MPQRHRQSHQGGFTLVEVVLAVAILALAMVTLGQTLGASAVAYRDIDDTRQAYMVAVDKLVEMQVYQQWPKTGTNDDEIARGDRQWWVRTIISSGPYPGTRRVDIEVGELRDGDRGDLLYEMASLIGKPAESGRSIGGGQQGGNSNAGSEDLTGG